MIASGLLAQSAAHAATPCASAPLLPASGNQVWQASYTKSQAILKGAPSQLDLIRMQQARTLYPQAGPAPATNTIIVRAANVRVEQPFPALLASPLPSIANFDYGEAAKAVAYVAPKALQVVFGAVQNHEGRHIEDCPSSFVQANRGIPRAPYTRSTAEYIRPGRPDIFGSVALAVSRTALDSKWRHASSASLNASGAPWSGLLAQNRNQARMTQIANINAWVNARIRYVDDVKEYGTADYWASAAQSLSRGRGDCEDYAIAKMQLLKALGVPADSMYLVIARDLVRRADHAILAVAMDGDLLVLDNETNRILRSAEVRDYRPVLSFNENRTWTHGYRPDSALPAVQLASLTR
ncbi:transglutaminase-like cysteine peptidase [Rhizorhapis sp. SPR117]|uniref:transglutaminase-like cysteine peptidase n=1 Tax=Rhizorhapis sp. SPR117 TaxID=2912611 RepID=UPI001F3CA4DD|nr:transglutaminase-like cysteine peptidase [Rhizorhapis sp. SPR117]